MCYNDNAVSELYTETTKNMHFSVISLHGQTIQNLKIPVAYTGLLVCVLLMKLHVMGFYLNTNNNLNNCVCAVQFLHMKLWCSS